MEDFFFHQRFDHIFAGLDYIVFTSTRSQFGEHLLVRRVVFHGDLHASLFRELIDNRLGDVFRPAVDIQVFSRRGGCGDGQAQGKKSEEETVDFFHDYLFLPKK